MSKISKYFKRPEVKAKIKSATVRAVKQTALEMLLVWLAKKVASKKG